MPAGTARAVGEPEPSIPEVTAAIDRVWPREIREGKRDASEREKKIGRLILLLTVADRSGERAVRRAEAMKEFDHKMVELREEYTGDAPEVRAELEHTIRLYREALLLEPELLNRPATFPTTRDAQLDLAGRVERVPAVVDRGEALLRELEYRVKRLSLLEQVGELRTATTRPGEDGRAAGERLVAAQDLLKATDAAYAAQAKFDRLTAPATAPSTDPGHR